MKQPVIERVEANIVQRLLKEENVDELRQRVFLIAEFLKVYSLIRKKTSRRQVEDCLKVIDTYYPQLIVPESL